MIRTPLAGASARARPGDASVSSIQFTVMTRRERDFLGERERGRRPCGMVCRPCGPSRTSHCLGGRSIPRSPGPSAPSSWRRCGPTGRSGYLEHGPAADALEQACRELFEGRLVDEIVVDALQGGAGHQHQHERERGAGQPGAGAAGRPARRLRTRVALRPLRTCTRAPTTRSRPRCGWRPSGALRSLEPAVVALQEAFQAKEREFAAHRQGGPDRDAGRGADDARARDGGVCGGPQSRPLAAEQVRGAPPRGQPRRDGHRDRGGGAARLHLQRRGRTARDHRPGAGAGGEPRRRDAERRRLRRGVRAAQGACGHAGEGVRRPAAAVVGPAARGSEKSGCRPGRRDRASCRARSTR